MHSAISYYLLFISFSFFFEIELRRQYCDWPRRFEALPTANPWHPLKYPLEPFRNMNTEVGSGRTCNKYMLICIYMLQTFYFLGRRRKRLGAHMAKAGCLCCHNMRQKSILYTLKPLEAVHRPNIFSFKSTATCRKAQWLREIVARW